MNTPWTLDYADGSGNGYRFFKETAELPVRFDYDPMTPMMSSSGHYSGGDPRQAVQLSKEQEQTLVEWYQRLRDNKDVHVKNRMKGTGLFKWKDSAGEERFIISMAGIREFKAFLETL